MLFVYMCVIMYRVLMIVSIHVNLGRNILPLETICIFVKAVQYYEEYS